MSWRRLASLWTLIAALTLAAAVAPAAAQDSFAGKPGRHLSAPQAARFGKALEQDLGARGVRVALVFRSGRPRTSMPEGLAYTHGAFWIYRDIAAADGEHLRGYAVYNLYHGDGETLPRSRSHLVQDWPTDFMQGSQEDDVAVIVPSPEMQRRLLGVIDSPLYERLHIASYSLIDNPFDPRHQNCNTFMLDVLGAAVWQTDNPAEIGAGLKAWFHPTTVKTGPLERLFGPMFDERLPTDDQKGAIVTASYESISAFMRDNRLVKDVYAFRRPAD